MLFGFFSGSLPTDVFRITVYVVSLEIGKYFWCPSKPTFDLSFMGLLFSRVFRIFCKLKSERFVFYSMQTAVKSFWP